MQALPSTCSACRRCVAGFGAAQGNEPIAEQAILDFYFSISTEVSASIKAAEEYNKAINDYVNGVNILNTIASYQNESN
ncbi:hypothetical protein [Klebsiella pneumoniae]|uniref:hypothetical protein n=1 Tax=Klebsiella pneumoniae TaxID=573 RepID=UPI00200E9B72|nr:hypothetical protein [Klebsiella pneumoniae]UPY99792.1 hypothetical protein MOV22_26640 [Klebsiella pneumoniae]